MTEQKTVDEVFRDRNLLAIAFATLVYRQAKAEPHADYAAGWSAPDANDADAEEWAIVWAELEGEQVSWHVPRDLAEESDLPRRPHNYDGHSRNLKNNRLRDFSTV